MQYIMWTEASLKKYSAYLENIAYEQIGFVNISGLYEISNLNRERLVVGYIYRIYDHNANCPDRELITGLGTGVMEQGIVQGIVIALAKDNATGSFFFDGKPCNPENATIVHPGSIWIALHYLGEIKLLGQQAVRDHQGQFHAACCTLDAQGNIQPALSGEHIEKFILPNVIESYAAEIADLDMNYSIGLIER